MKTFDHISTRASRAVFEVRSWHLAAAVVTAFLLAAIFAPRPGISIMLVVGLFMLVCCWFREFLYLMSLGNDDLPGRYDKLIWAGLFLLVPPVGLLMFLIFRRLHFADAKPSAERELA